MRGHIFAWQCVLTGEFRLYTQITLLALLHFLECGISFHFMWFFVVVVVDTSITLNTSHIVVYAHRLILFTFFSSVSE